MGREKALAILVIALLLPGVFAAEAEKGDSLANAITTLKFAKTAIDAVTGFFSASMEFGERASSALNIGQFHTTLLYDSAIVPENAVGNYFAGVGTKSGSAEKYTQTAWTEINQAKKAYAEADAACGSLSAKCPELVYKTIEYLGKGNANALNAGEAALAETLGNLNKLEHMGGDVAEYGGMPFETYSSFTNEYEAGTKYNNFKTAIEKYGYIHTQGKAMVRCNIEKIGGLGLFDYMFPQFVPLKIALELAECIEITPSRLATNYYSAYNALVGARNPDSGIKAVLAANKEILGAIKHMETEHQGVTDELDAGTKALEEIIKEAEDEGAKEVNYEKVAQISGAIAQTPAELLEHAKESRYIGGVLAKKAEATKAFEQDNYLAMSIIEARQALEETRHGIRAAETAKEILSGMRRELAATCSEEAVEAMQRASENGMFSITAVEEISGECDTKWFDKDGEAINKLVETINSLRFIKASENEKAEMALYEIELLERMVEKAENDFSVDEEKLALETAMDYAGPDWPIEQKPLLLERAYGIAVSAQESIWAKAEELFSGLPQERRDAKALVGKMAEAGKGSGLLLRFEEMEGHYSGVICLDSLGHLLEAKALYREIKEEAKTALAPEELLITFTEKEFAGNAECGQEIMVANHVFIRNPYNFEVDGIAPNSEVEEFFETWETPLSCGRTKEKVLWVYPDKETRSANRNITVSGVAKALVDFPVDGALAALSPRTEIVNGKPRLELDYPENTSVEVEYEAESGLAVYGPSCETDGEKVTCRYVLFLECRGSQDVNVLLPRPLSLQDEVSASNGRAENAGPMGIIINGVDCPGHSTVDVKYMDLAEASEGMLNEIREAIGRLEGLEKDGFQKRYGELSKKSPGEVISRGGKLLGEIEEALKKQALEQQDDLMKEQIGALRKELEGWLIGRGFELPWLPSDDYDAVTALEKEKELRLSELAEEYSALAEKASELKQEAKVLKEFGLEAEKVEEFSIMVQTKPSDEYLLFANTKGQVEKAWEGAEKEIEELAGKVFFDVPERSDALQKACDMEVDLEGPEFVLGREFCSDTTEKIGEVIRKAERGNSLLDGTPAGLGAIAKEGITPEEIGEEYAALVLLADKKIIAAKKVTEAKIEGADEYYAGIAEKRLAEGYVNQAYAYATQKKAASITWLLTAGNAMLLMAPIAIAVVVWQLRKKQKAETKVQKAMRLLRK